MPTLLKGILMTFTITNEEWSWIKWTFSSLSVSGLLLSPLLCKILPVTGTGNYFVYRLRLTSVLLSTTVALFYTFILPRNTTEVKSGFRHDICFFSPSFLPGKISGRRKWKHLTRRQLRLVFSERNESHVMSGTSRTDWR